MYTTLLKEKEKNSSAFIFTYMEKDKVNYLTNNVGRNFLRMDFKKFQLFKNFNLKTTIERYSFTKTRVEAFNFT